MTNQAGIARGYYDAAAVNKLHRWVQQQLAELGAHVDDIRFCPHHPDGNVPALSIVCDCRKPQAGMLESLKRQWNPDTARSFMLGDSDKDVAAGSAAGILSRKVPTGKIASEIEKILAESG